LFPIMRVKHIRGNILGSVVDARSWSLLLMIRPGRCEDFKCFSAQKEIKGFAPLLIQDLAQKFIKLGSLPSARPVNPPLVSSSGPPGACITPSTVIKDRTISFRMVVCSFCCLY